MKPLDLIPPSNQISPILRMTQRTWCSQSIRRQPHQRGIVSNQAKPRQRMLSLCTKTVGLIPLPRLLLGRSVFILEPPPEVEVLAVLHQDANERATGSQLLLPKPLLGMQSISPHHGPPLEGMRDPRTHECAHDSNDAR
ncbi:hypothetical protein [Streptomyces noursei]|uniref:hypothetical protein n=1 Tax=Streptomyces noursei TaxID=1971 RepID=UPI0035DF477E